MAFKFFKRKETKEENRKKEEDNKKDNPKPKEEKKKEKDKPEEIKQQDQQALSAVHAKKIDDKRVGAEREKIRNKFEVVEEKKKEKERKEVLDKHLKKDMNKLKKEKQKKLFVKKKKKFSLRGLAKNINLQDYIDKAGLDAEAKKISKNIFKISIYTCFFISLLSITANIVFKKGFINLLTFLLGFWLTIFFFLLAFLWIIYLFYIDMKIFQRTKAVELVFPDFLQLASANISAGMPIDRALWYAVRPGFGVLAKEIEIVAKNTMAGEDLAVALTNFGKKYDSKVIQRSINLLIEGMASGGKMADLLSKISLNIEETRILKKEMAASVTTYVIFIAFATIIAAPVLFGLATQLLAVIKQITSTLGSTMASSKAFFSFSFSSESIKTSDFKIFSYLMLSVSAFSSACIISVIKKGRIKEGLTQIPVFIIITIILYTLSNVIIGGMFKGFI